MNVCVRRCGCFLSLLQFRCHDWTARAIRWLCTRGKYNVSGDLSLGVGGARALIPNSALTRERLRELKSCLRFYFAARKCTDLLSHSRQTRHNAVWIYSLSGGLKSRDFCFFTSQTWIGSFTSAPSVTVVGTVDSSFALKFAQKWWCSEFQCNSNVACDKTLNSKFFKYFNTKLF